MASDIEFIKQLYQRFNARDVEALLSTMSEDVIWANGMDGGYVYGHEGVRSYWTRQWAVVDPRVQPLNLAVGADGEILVEVHQVVRNLRGELLADKMVGHIFRMENGRDQAFRYSCYVTLVPSGCSTRTAFGGIPSS